MTELTKEQKRAIIETAKDLNKAMDLDPKIEIEFKSDAEGKVREEEESKFVLQLVEDVVKAANLLESTDQIKDETIGVLEMLEIDGIRDKMRPEKQKEQKKISGSKKKTGREKSEKKQEVAPKSSAKKYTRIEAAVEVIKVHGINADNLFEKSDELYVAKGGKTNIKEAKTVCTTIIKFYEALDFVGLQVASKGK